MNTELIQRIDQIMSETTLKDVATSLKSLGTSSGREVAQEIQRQFAHVPILELMSGCLAVIGTSLIAGNILQDAESGIKH